MRIPAVVCFFARVASMCYLFLWFLCVVARCSWIVALAVQPNIYCCQVGQRLQVLTGSGQTRILCFNRW
ncbi:hypothetical protein BDV17DRAFT_252367 [Aspergillus undulatus]